MAAITQGVSATTLQATAPARDDRRFGSGDTPGSDWTNSDEDEKDQDYSRNIQPVRGIYDPAFAETRTPRHSGRQYSNPSQSLQPVRGVYNPAYAETTILEQHERQAREAAYGPPPPYVVQETEEERQKRKRKEYDDRHRKKVYDEETEEQRRKRLNIQNAKKREYKARRRNA